MGGSRSTPRPTRGASETDDGSAETLGADSAVSSGALAAAPPARGGASSVRPSRISVGGGGGGTRSGAAAKAEPPADNSSKHQRISRAATRPITVRNMARHGSAAKPDQRPM